MTDQRLTAWKTAGEWVCETGQTEGDVGWRRVHGAFPSVSERQSRWLAALAREHGYNRDVIEALLSETPRQPVLSADSIPSADIPIEELIARRISEFNRVDAAAVDERVVRVNCAGPIGFLLMGDPHVDDSGTNFPLLVEHVNLINRTEGLFAADIGDVLNQWYGRLAHLYKEQSTSQREAWQLVEWLYRSVPWLFSIAGNHVLWGDGNLVFERILRNAAVTVAHPHETKIRLELPDRGSPFRIWARHDFSGRSQWNSIHGMLKAAKMRDYRANLYVAGHTHDAALYTEPRESGELYTALRLGSYKVHDDYAAEKGFPKKRGGEAALVIIDKDRHLVTFDVEAGADYLSWLRRRG